MECDLGKFTVLVLTDSRGRDLEEMMNENSEYIGFQVKVFPGASIGTLAKKLHRILGVNRGSRYHLVVILGGICSITKIEYMPYRVAMPRMESTDGLMSIINNEFDMLFGSKLDIPILLAPTVGIDLTRYAGQWNEELFRMQPLIDRTILEVNTRMREINDDNGLPTPNTSSCVHHCRGKGRGYRTHYQKLYDGCHPDEEVKAVWAKVLVNCCEAILKPKTTE